MAIQGRRGEREGEAPAEPQPTRAVRTKRSPSQCALMTKLMVAGCVSDVMGVCEHFHVLFPRALSTCSRTRLRVELVQRATVCAESEPLAAHPRETRKKSLTAHSQSAARNPLYDVFVPLGAPLTALVALPCSLLLALLLVDGCSRVLRQCRSR